MKTLAGLIAVLASATALVASCASAAPPATGAEWMQLGRHRLPKHLCFLKDHPEGRPSSSLLAGVRPADRAALLVHYHAQTPGQRVAVTWALAYIADDRVVGTLTNSLVGWRSKKHLSNAELATLVETLRALGLAAQENDRAYAFLTNATTLGYWETNRWWTSTEDLRFTDVLFAAEALGGMGLSGRAEAAHYLSELVKSGNTTLRHPLDPPCFRRLHWYIVDGIFYREMLQRHGKARFREGIWDNLRRWRGEWEASESGKKWGRFIETSFGPRPP